MTLSVRGEATLLTSAGSEKSMLSFNCEINKRADVDVDLFCVCVEIQQKYC